MSDRISDRRWANGENAVSGNETTERKVAFLNLSK